MVDDFEQPRRVRRLYQVQKQWPDEYADPEFPEFESKTKAMYLCSNCAQEDGSAIDLLDELEDIPCQRCHRY